LTFSSIWLSRQRDAGLFCLIDFAQRIDQLRLMEDFSFSVLHYHADLPYSRASRKARPPANNPPFTLLLVMAIIDLMGLIELALKAALIYAGSFVLVWLGAMYGADEANSTQARTGDETDRQLRKQAIARSAGLMIACLPVVIWIIWTCVQAANSSPD